MIFFTKLTKQKKFNSSGFTLLELLLVIVIIGIIVGSLSFNFSPNKLQLTADQILRDIRFTQSLALKDDKYQPFPKSTSTADQNQSKYWFKQWWQIKFATDSGDKIYYIFSDSAGNNSTNFDRKILASTFKKEIVKGPNGFYMYGGDTYLPSGVKTNKELNLTKNGIVRIELKMGSVRYSNGSVHLLFDNFGNIFLNEGNYSSVSTIAGDSGDINPLDSVRTLVTSDIHINLCTQLNNSNYCLTDDKHCIGITVSPNGESYISKCITIY